MNKIEAMQAQLNGLTIYHPGELSSIWFFDFELLMFMRKSVDSKDEWKEDWNLKLCDGWKVYEVPKREFDLKPFDRVLVRDHDNQMWTLDFFSHVNDYTRPCTFTCIGNSFDQLALYVGNEDKLGTTDDIENKWTKEDL